MRTSLLLFLLLLFQSGVAQTIGGHAISLEEEEMVDLYLYTGYAEDWNTISAAWDAKRISRHTRATTVRRMLPNQAKSSLDQLEEYLVKDLGINRSALQRYWIAPVIRVQVSERERILLEQSELVAEVIPVPEVTPDDDMAPMPGPPVPNGREPGHDVIGAPQLWNMGYTGYGRKVYIIDSGVDPAHPALGEKYWGNYAPTNEAWFEPGGDNSPRACGNHGTLVAGVILGLNRSSNDTTGVAPEALWMASPPAGGAPCASVDILQALQWAIDPDGDSTTVDDQPDVINNSWSISLGSSNAECTGPYRDAMAALEASGIAVVFSAGNTGPGTQSIPSPKNLNINPVNVFTVGSVNGNSPTLPIAGSSARGPSTCTGPQDTIKPEVVAPGVQVRTTGPNGGYFTTSGTSFAAPQAAGAVLILKEAFPGASGKQILESLYYSAIDLGDAGEDNTFGNGVISLPDAYNWLITQGFSPVVINDSNNVAIGNLSLGDKQTCDSIVYPIAVLSNNGPNQITSLAARRTRNGQTDTIFWQGAINPGSTAFWGIPGDTVDVGNYQFELTIFQVNGGEDYRFLDNIVSGNVVRLPSAVPTINLPVICKGERLYADAGESGSFAWYDGAFSDQPVAEGNRVLLGPYFNDGFVYVARKESLVAGKSNNGDVGNYSTDNAYLIFDAEVPFIIRSVKVFSQGDGNRRIQLRESNGTVLLDTTVFLNFGERIVELNASVSAGTDFQLGINSPLTRLLTTSSGVSYPYEVSGSVSVKNSSLGPLFYPYFFDWQIEYEGCRQAVAVEVEEGQAEAELLPKDTLIYLALGGEWSADLTSPLNASVSWDMGDGTQLSGNSILHPYDSAGRYTVFATALGQDGCSVSDSASVTVVDWALSGGYGREWSIDIFPNPASDQIVLSWQALPPAQLETEMFDMYGRRVLNRVDQPTGGTIRLDISMLVPGQYILRCKSGNQQCVHRIQVSP